MTLARDGMIRRIGFVSMRIARTDGVSLEIGKWTEILQRLGYECFFITGDSDRDPKRTFLIPEADFQHPDIREINEKCFGRQHRTRQISHLIQMTAASIKRQLYEAIQQFDIDVLIAENALTIPMNIPLGLALVELLIETPDLPSIAHHHDFVWERERFLVNAVHDHIAATFPPRLSEIEHVIINSLAGEEFSRRTGLPYRMIPNVMNFNQPPPPPDEYCADFRKMIGIGEDDLLILQPTRVVHRKGIEHSIELVRCLNDPRCRLVITHSEDDEGPEYPRRIRRYAELLGVELIFASHCIRHCRCTLPDGCKCFSIWDAYREADLVTYPSTYEGFGNAFLEAVYFKKPLFCNRYSIFRADIEPLGFRAALINGFLTDEAVEEVRRLLYDADYRREVVDHNYQLAKRYFSYDRAETELRTLLASMQKSPP